MQMQPPTDEEIVGMFLGTIVVVAVIVIAAAMTEPNAAQALVQYLHRFF